MKHRGLLLLFFAFLSVILHAQLLWEVSTRNGKKTSYIIGTHELIPAHYLDSIQDVYKAYNRCDIVISNIEMNAIDDNTNLKQYALLPDNENVRNYLGDSEAQLVDTVLKKYLNLNLQSVGKFHPRVINSLLLNAYFSTTNKLKDDVQSDAFFQQTAVLKGKQVVGLGKSDTYLKQTFKSASKSEEAQILYENCLKTDSICQIMSNLAKYYKKNKLKQTNNELVKLIGKCNLQPFDQASLAKLAGLMRANTCFYVADIRQLFGGNSIIEQLRGAGFTVQPFLSKNKLQTKLTVNK
jgi:uncharacterized protein YbaP (TraB family)